MHDVNQACHSVGNHKSISLCQKCELFFVAYIMKAIWHYYRDILNKMLAYIKNMTDDNFAFSKRADLHILCVQPLNYCSAKLLTLWCTLQMRNCI